jgi:large subunit ribosomal protein L35
LLFSVLVAIDAASPHRPADKGCRGDVVGSGAFQKAHGLPVAEPKRFRRLFYSETSKMPKMKTKSGAKKRFKITGTGKVVHAQQGKRHGMIKRTNKQIRKLRGTRVLFKTDGDNVKKYFLPNG